MEEAMPLKSENDNQGTSDGEMKQPDVPSVAFDYKQDLAQFADINVKYEETNKMYICHLCDFRTAFRNSLLNHQAVHSDFRPWVCAICDYAAKRKQDLKKHLHTIHGVMVESTMLKPIGASGAGTCTSVSGLSRGESSEDNSWDSMKLSKTGDTLHLQTTPESAKAAGHVTGPMDVFNFSIKQEMLDKSPTPTNQGAFAANSNANGSPPDSPDYDLPVTFSPALVSKQKYSLPATDSQSISEKVWPTSEVAKKVSQADIKSHHQSSPSSLSSQLHKRHYSSLDGSNTQDLSASPMNKVKKTMEAEDHLPCSSSISVSHARASQTPNSFLCQHCDILFFQRAMYLMHVGLHSLDNPWCCAVCGSTFTEKYSFTSHFINQH